MQNANLIQHHPQDLQAVSHRQVDQVDLDKDHLQDFLQEALLLLQEDSGKLFMKGGTGYEEIGQRRRKYLHNNGVDGEFGFTYQNCRFVA